MARLIKDLRSLEGAGRPADVRDALYSFVHDTAIPLFVDVCIVLLALALGAFALRGFHVVGLQDRNQVAQKAP